VNTEIDDVSSGRFVSLVQHTMTGGLFHVLNVNMKEYQIIVGYKKIYILDYV
jgi:hypothetical protein